MGSSAAVLGAVSRRVDGHCVRLQSSRSHNDDVCVEVDASSFSNAHNLQLHWGVARIAAPSNWTLAPDEARPEGTTPFGDGIACRTPLGAGNKAIFLFSSACLRNDMSPDGSSPEVVNGKELLTFNAILIESNPDAEDRWLHAEDGEGDLCVPLRTPPPRPSAAQAAASMTTMASSFEAEKHVNLFRRYCVVKDALRTANEIDGVQGIAVLYAWLRLSNMRLLPWHDGGNYQGKDMTHVQRDLANSMAAFATKEGEKAHYARLSLAMLPRGGGDGDAIRMGILQIMRENGIKEGHRPGIEDKFIEQWHQKLHSNTTMDDIAICEAYLHFLRGNGDWGDFWWHLYEHHKLTKQYLSSIKAGWRSNGITGPANHLPHLIPGFQHFLWVLKIAHSGNDMDTAMQMARGGLSNDLQWDIDDLLRNRDQWWVPGKIVHIRKRLLNSEAMGASGDSDMRKNIMLLDISLEAFFQTHLQRMNLDTLKRDDLVALLELALENGLLALDIDELWNALKFWRRLQHADSNLEMWSNNWALIAEAALESIAVALARFLDSLCRNVSEPACIIGQASNVAEASLRNFGEEVSRGHTLKAISSILTNLQDEVSQILNQTSWYIIGQPKAKEPVVGKVLLQNLAELQGDRLKADSHRSIILSPELDGMEDISPHVAAVLTRSRVDILSHIAIRARNSGILLASCTRSSTWEAFSRMEGAICQLSVTNGDADVRLHEASSEQIEASRITKNDSVSRAHGKVQVKAPEIVHDWIIESCQFGPSVVGGKSVNLEKLRHIAADLEQVVVPACFALPYGTFERAIGQDKELEQQYLSLVSVLSNENTNASNKESTLRAVRDTVMKVKMPQELKTELDNVSGKFRNMLPNLSEPQDGPTVDCDDFPAWNAIKKVWASKWTERAYYNRKANGVAEDDLYMAVLCMELIAADYAFVLHSSNPVTGNEDEVVGEIVVGLGETLVSNSAGRALCFTASKHDSSDFKIQSFPSKVFAYFNPAGGTMIARSDSNGEDLEEFAGAGLYDSVTAEPTAARALDYSAEPLIWDSSFRNALISRLVNIAKNVETSIGRSQDIEGCVAEGKVYLLQARAQV